MKTQRRLIEAICVPVSTTSWASACSDSRSNELGEGDEALQLAPHRAPEFFPGLDPTVGVPIAEVGGEVLQISRQVPPLECLPHRDMNRVQASGEIWR
jgi:hypothetical protein